MVKLILWIIKCTRKLESKLIDKAKGQMLEISFRDHSLFISIINYDKKNENTSQFNTLLAERNN